jgi:hypothetical protein
MAGLTVGSEIKSVFPMGASVRARRAAEVAHYSRGRGGESGAGFEPAG